MCLDDKFVDLSAAIRRLHWQTLITWSHLESERHALKQGKRPLSSPYTMKHRAAFMTTLHLVPLCCTNSQLPAWEITERKCLGRCGQARQDETCLTKRWRGVLEVTSHFSTCHLTSIMTFHALPSDRPMGQPMQKTHNQLKLGNQSKYHRSTKYNPWLRDRWTSSLRIRGLYFCWWHRSCWLLHSLEKHLTDPQSDEKQLSRALDKRGQIKHMQNPSL